MNKPINLTDKIKLAGQELIDRAEDLIPKDDMLCGFDIRIRFDPGAAITIESTAATICKNEIKLYAN